MASIQAHLAAWIVKWRVKRRLKGVRDYRRARAILKPDPYRVPSSIRVNAAHLGEIPGEWVEGPPEYGWLGVKWVRRKRLPITAYRCPSCGYLETYARAK